MPAQINTSFVLLQALVHKRALRNGALAAMRPASHEAFEFWHDDGGGSGLESHGSREGAAAYSDQQARSELQSRLVNVRAATRIAS